MFELTDQQIAVVGGGLKWDSDTCAATFTIGGAVVGGVLGGPGGAGVGLFVGDWIGDNFCPAPFIQ